MRAFGGKEGRENSRVLRSTRSQTRRTKRLRSASKAAALLPRGAGEPLELPWAQRRAAAAHRSWLRTSFHTRAFSFMLREGSGTGVKNKNFSTYSTYYVSTDIGTVLEGAQAARLGRARNPVSTHKKKDVQGGGCTTLARARGLYSTRGLSPSKGAGA